MKRNFLLKILSVIFLVVSLCFTVACSGPALDPNHEHEFMTTWTKTETHHYHACSCGEKQDEAEHTFDDGNVTLLPSESEEGEETFTCTVCSATKIVKIPKLEAGHTHDYSTNWSKSQTHHWYECSCGAKSSYEEHDWDDGLQTKQANCTEKGEITYKCKVCDDSKIEETPISHDFPNEYSTDDRIHWKKCNNCDEEILKSVHIYDDGKCECGIEEVAFVKVDENGVQNTNGNYILFGEYPQTLKKDNVTITETQDSRGYYLGSDYYYYAKLIANPYADDYTFSDGTVIEKGHEYYFRVEPVKWKILKADGNKLFIFSDLSLEFMPYDSDNINNYKDSDIRAWLNNQFYTGSFSALQQKLITTTIVNNSGWSTGEPHYANRRACDDTLDRVFLLSVQETVNTDYGFKEVGFKYDITSDENRTKVVSDLVAAKGPYLFRQIHSWWLRSPYCGDDERVVTVNSDGSIYLIDGYSGYGSGSKYNDCIVPALCINLDNENHEHNFSETYTKNETHHWNECSCGEKINHTKHQFINGVCTCGNTAPITFTDSYLRVDKNGNADPNGGYVLFGEYPQSVKAENVTITDYVDSRGYLLGSDNYYYSRKTANPINHHKFDDGTAIYSYTYYFKVEPIKWRILSEESGSMLIASDRILIGKVFNYALNDYSKSLPRTWLNDEFYNSAFSYSQQSKILNRTVDNTPASTGSAENQYACANTYDNIFLLSYQEVTNSNYGFSTSDSAKDTARQLKTTEYARAMGILTDNVWWLRSPSSARIDAVWSVHEDGHLYANLTQDRTLGIVPALRLAV